jgi:hypothetical protein
MSAIVAYLIKSILISGVLFFYYQLFLKNKSFHSFNRFFLMAIVALSAIAPLINIEWLNAKADNNPFYLLVERAGTTVEPHANVFSTANSWVLIASSAISLSFLVALGCRIRWIYRIKRLYRNTRGDGFTFIETDVKQAPFSFFNNLFWKQGLSLTDTNGEKILKHELAHIRQKHSCDRLFVQTMSCIFWLNPFYWLLQKELVTVHEFIADDAAVGNGNPGAFATMLLYSHNNGSYLSPAHHFFNSQIKRRLTMISSSKTTKYSWLRKALVFPLAIAVIFALSLNSKAQATRKVTIPVEHSSLDTVPKQSQEPITVVGYSSKKKGKQPTTPASAESLKPVTVAGRKLEKKETEKKEEKKAF